MGKTIDQLNLKDEPIVAPAAIDIRDTDWYRFRAEIESLLGTGEYEWAADTLSSIAESVEKYRSVTDGQRRAVQNIENAKRRVRPEGGFRRRYEGYR